MTESKYFRGSNFYLLATAALLAWAPTLPLFFNGVNEVASAQDDPIEPPPAETPRKTPSTTAKAPAVVPPNSTEPDPTNVPDEPAGVEPDNSAEPDPTGNITPENSSEPDLSGGQENGAEETPTEEAPTAPDDLLDSTQSKPAMPPSLAGGSDPVSALADARAAMAASQWRTAIDCWTTVLGANPLNVEAKKGLQTAQAQLDQGGGSLLDKVSDDITLRRQRLTAEFENDLFRGGEKLNRGDYAGAQLDASSAKQLVARDKAILIPAQFDAMNNRADALIDQINASRIAGQTLDQAKQRGDAQKASTDAQRMAQQKRLATISEMLMRVRQLQMELKYDEALQVIDQILFMDPSNPAALALRDVLESTKMYRQWSDAQRQRNSGFGQMQLQDMQAAIPPKINLAGNGPKSTNALIIYPEDWPRISMDNKNFPPAGWARTAEDEVIAKQFENVFDFPETTNQKLSQVLDFWKQITKIPLYVNWKALGEIEITPETEGIQLDKANVSARVMLTRILEQVGNPTSDSGRAVSEIMNGQVAVTTFTALQNLPEAKRPRVYDLTDLVFKYPDSVTVPPLSISGGGGVGGGFPLIPFITDDGKAGRVIFIKDLIQKTVDPDAWNLGASMEPFDTKLVITARPDTHRNIADLLQQIRADLALQINIEVRVLKIDTDWFEQIGLDFDMYFNTNNSQYQQARTADPNFNLRDFFFQNADRTAAGDAKTGQLKNPIVFSGITGSNAGPLANSVATGQAIGLPGTTGQIQYQTGPVGTPIALQPNGTAYADGSVSNGLSAINVQQEGLPLVNTLGAAGIKGVFGAAALANPALTVGMTFLDDVQVDLLVRATQADQRNVLMTSPRLTMQNGQISFITVQNTTSYVSGFTVPTTQGVTGTPIVSSISEGFSLGLQGVISADRRYVSLNVSFQLQGPVTFASVQFQQSVAGGSQVPVGTTSTNTFQTPNFLSTSIGTTITVPDKGTAVLGGQRVTTDYEVEVGVPVLSKIPMVNRFFTNRINSKVEQTLMMMIRPEILIQQETEDVLFPGLRNQLGESGGNAGM